MITDNGGRGGCAAYFPTSFECGCIIIYFSAFARDGMNRLEALGEHHCSLSQTSGMITSSGLGARSWRNKSLPELVFGRQDLA